MDFLELRNFINDQMRMQHIYQPIMLKILLESDNNKASVRKIAHAFLQKDESQLEYYIKLLKRCPKASSGSCVIHAMPKREILMLWTLGLIYGLTESDLRACAKHLQDETTQMQATVDGMPIQNLQMYRVQTPLFNITFPSNNAAGVSAGTTQAVADGNWVFLKPLSPGKHELHFSGASVDFTSTGTNAFATDATYHLTVRP